MIRKSVVIIGAGPAGLMAAEVLSLAGVKVDVYDAMPSAGRKFLMAGKGGMNITHSEPFDRFLSRYGGRSSNLEPMLNDFSPEKLRNWLSDLGIATFVGSSGRVFPTEMKAAPLLRAWLHRLRASGVRLHMRHRWLDWTPEGKLRFVAESQGEVVIQADAVILALGGGSWPQFGSTGEWQKPLALCGVDVVPLQPANCGFEVAWSEYFRDRFAGQPLKSVRMGLDEPVSGQLWRPGELMITNYGLEGGLIYSFSRQLREKIINTGEARIYLDLIPNLDIETVKARLALPKSKLSISNFLRKRLGVDSLKLALLREALSVEAMQNVQILASALKALPIILSAPRPLAEAISSAGGVKFEALDQHLMLLARPGVFCAGEMLDWEAPTGGYLLTACFASGRAAGFGVLSWLQQRG